MGTDDPRALLASREALWRAIGVSRRVIWTTHFACAVLAAGLVAQGVERWAAGRACENKVSVIEVPESGLPSRRVLTSYDAWIPSDGVWIAAAREWIWLVRSRSTDVGTERHQVPPAGGDDRPGPVAIRRCLAQGAGANPQPGERRS